MLHLVRLVLNSKHNYSTVQTMVDVVHLPVAFGPQRNTVVDRLDSEDPISRQQYSIGRCHIALTGGMLLAYITYKGYIILPQY